MLRRLLEVNSGIVFYGVRRSTQKTSSSLKIMYFNFQKDRKHILGNLPKNGLVHTKYNSGYQITLCFWWLSVKFDPNLVLVNVNKLKPCHFLDEKT
jgi:hypothetical protein